MSHLNKLVLIIMVSFSLICFVMFLSYKQDSTLLDNKIHESHKKIANSKTSVLRNLLLNKLEKVNNLITGLDIAITLQKRIFHYDKIDAKPPTKIDKENLSNIANQILNNKLSKTLIIYKKSNQGEFTELFITNSKGYVVAKTNKMQNHYYGEQMWFKEAITNKTPFFYYNTIKELNQFNLLCLVVPIIGKDGKFIGTISTEFSLIDVFSLVELSYENMGGSIYIMSSNGHIITGPENTTFSKKTLQNKKPKDFLDDIAKQGAIYNPIDIPIYKITPTKDDKTNGLTYKWTQVFWYLFLEKDKISTSQATDKLKGQFFFSIAITALFIAVVFLLILFYIIKPVRKLIKTLNAATKEDNIKLLDDSQSKSETGQLSRNFNILLNKLKTYSNSLELEKTINTLNKELTKALFHKKNIEEISLIILKQGQLLTGSLFGYVGYIDSRTGYLVVPTLTHDIWNICEVEAKQAVFDKFVGFWGWVLEEGKPILVNKPKEDPRSSGTPPGHIPINRFISAPAIIDGKVVGQVALANSKVDYTQKDMVIVEYLSEFYAIALEGKQAEELDKQSEYMVIHQAKLASIGEMIGSIIYQWRQPINSISQLAAQLKESFESKEITVKYITEFNNKFKSQLNYMSNAIDDFKNFFKPDKIKIPFDINSITKEAVSLLKANLMQNNIEIELSSSTDGIINGYPNELKQISVILINNIRNAIADNQSKTRPTAREKKKINMEIYKEDKKIAIKIRDNGGGLPEKILNNMFTPYFTNIQRQENIGLYMCKLIIEQHMGGSLFAVNDEKGTTFVIKLNPLKLQGK